MNKKVKRTIWKSFTSVVVAGMAFLILQFAFVSCTPSIPPICKPQFTLFFNIFFGAMIGVIFYLGYSVFQKSR